MGVAAAKANLPNARTSRAILVASPPRARRAAACLLVSFLLSCGRKEASDAAGFPAPASSAASAVSVAPSAQASASALSPGGIPQADDRIEPVYPAAPAEPHPLAVELCDALHALPAKRKAECCSSRPGFEASGECVRVLSHALRAGAVTLDPADVAACAAAMASAHEGCGWVSPGSAPVPEACDGIVRGTLREGKRCRSSLECLDGLRCQGASATATGSCGPPRSPGRVCGTAVDVLAALVRQDRFEEKHPECDGFCYRHRCVAFVAAGGACKVSAACGPGRHCASGTCREGPPPAGGAPCTDACAGRARCIAGRCVEPKPEGASCTADAECRGACVRADAGRSGTCAMSCR